MRLNALESADLLDILWKSRLKVVAGIVVGLSLAVLAVFTLPRSYRASTLILVEAPKIPANYVRTTVTTTMEERINTIEQQITNRENLERIIQEMDLYPDLRAKKSMEQIVNRMRRDLSVLVQGTRVFRITFESRDQEVVATVANRIAEMFIDQNLRLRQDQAEGTTDFLKRELASMKRELEEQEAKVTSFRLENDGALPDQRQANLSAVAQLESRMGINRDATNKLELEKALLEQSTQSEEPESPPTTLKTSQLEALEKKRLQLRAQYTESHPSVIRLEVEITRLRQEIEDSPQQLQKDDETDNSSLSQKLLAVERNLRGLETERQHLLGEMARYQSRLENTPGIEQQLLSLTRDYDNLRSTYESLLTKRIDAQLAERLESQRQSEQFRILERAIPPLAPYWPKKGVLYAAGIALGGILGVALALLSVVTVQTFRSESELVEAFPGVGFVAAISQISLPEKSQDSDYSWGRRGA